MNFSLLYLLAKMSVVLAVWPPTIDPRLVGITKMQIKIEAKLEKTTLILEKTWLSGVLDITPEFVATVDKTRLLIKEELISDVLQGLKTTAEVDIEAAVKAHMENVAEADKKNAAKIGPKKPANVDVNKANIEDKKKTVKADRKKLRDLVMDHACCVRFSLVVVSYTNPENTNIIQDRTFQELKMYLPIHYCYSYFKLQGGKKIKDGEKLQFHHKTYEYQYPGDVTNVIKNREEQVEVSSNPLYYKEITYQNESGISEIDGTFGLTGPYYGCDVVLAA